MSRRRPGTPPVEVLTFPSAADAARRLPQLLAGVGLCGAGIAFLVRARLGLSPWDVFHQGVSEVTGIDFGAVVVLVGLLVLLVWIPLRQRPGIGTVLNTVLVGVVADGVLSALPAPSLAPARVALLLGGILSVGLGTGLYIGAGLGPGPRDGLMTALAAKGAPVWLVRTLIEVSVLVAGWQLGGDVGVGTVLFAFAIGPIAHLFISRFHLSPTGDLGKAPGVSGD